MQRRIGFAQPVAEVEESWFSQTFRAHALVMTTEVGPSQWWKPVSQCFEQGGSFRLIVRNDRKSGVSERLLRIRIETIEGPEEVYLDSVFADIPSGDYAIVTPTENVQKLLKKIHSLSRKLED